MAAWSCWMAAWVAAICSGVAGALPAPRAAWAVVTAALAAWLTPSWAALTWDCWSAWAWSSASWSAVRFPWSTWTWRWSAPQSPAAWPSALGDVVLVGLLVGRQQRPVGADLRLGRGHRGVGRRRGPVSFCWAADSWVWAAATWSWSCWTSPRCPPACSGPGSPGRRRAWPGRRPAGRRARWCPGWPAPGRRAPARPRGPGSSVTVPVVGMFSWASSAGWTTPAADSGLDSIRSLTATPSRTAAPRTMAPTTTPRAPRRRRAWELGGGPVGRRPRRLVPGGRASGGGRMGRSPGGHGRALAARSRAASTAAPAAAPATAPTPTISAGRDAGPGSVGVGTSLRGRVSPAMTSLSRATAGRPASSTECIGSGRPPSWAETQWFELGAELAPPPRGAGRPR